MTYEKGMIFRCRGSDFNYEVMLMSRGSDSCAHVCSCYNCSGYPWNVIVINTSSNDYGLRPLCKCSCCVESTQFEKVEDNNEQV